MSYPTAIVIAAALIAGAIATTGARSADPEPLDLARLRVYLEAIDAVVVNLAVDTERSAIGIAELNTRFRSLERRVEALEMKSAD